MKNLYIVNNLRGYLNVSSITKYLSVFLIVADNTKEAELLLYNYLYNSNSLGCVADIKDQFLIDRNRVEVYLSLMDCIIYRVEESYSNIIEVKNKLVGGCCH